MNVYAVIILAALIGGFVLDLVAELLNLRALRAELPGEFEGVYDPEDYRRSQDYTRERTRLHLLEASVLLVVTLIFWFSGGFRILDEIVRDWKLGSIGTGLVYIGLLVLGSRLLALPFALYSTFVIEERYGFNRTTPRTFAADIVKGVLVAVLLGVPLLAALLYFFDRVGTAAWLYAWVFTTAYLLFVQLVYPAWILPIFNKYEPLAEGELRTAFLGYAERADFPMENVWVMDGSRRSTKSNAFFTGFGRRKRLALFDTLIEKHSVAELVAILAHEVGHHKKGHIWKGLVIGILHAGLVFYLLSIFLHHPGLFEAFYMETPSVYAGLVFFGMLYAPVELILSVLLGWLSRRHEYEADAHAVETVDAPGAMAEALKKLSRDHLSNLTPHPFYVLLHHSHPPVIERIRAIERRQEVKR